MQTRKPLAAFTALLLCLGLLAACGKSPEASSAATPSVAAPGSAASEAQSSTPPSENNNEPDGQTASPATGLPDEMRAMWIAYPDLELVDFATEALFRDQMQTMLDECVYMGLNTVFFIVRPFSDALYESSYFPWSYLANGVQGVDPGYDPLAIAVEEAHSRGLRLEAYINPYRVKLNSVKPGSLSADNPAIAQPELARYVGDSMWYDPGLPAVRELVVNGVKEIVENYDVDGIHFDDYFYPSFSSTEEDEAFDAVTYAQYGGGTDKAAWRRGNVNTLITDVYTAIKAIDPAVSFGISPQGNNDNNYNEQYSDVNLWLAQPGYVDYVLPQLYWGFDWRSGSGAANAAFENKCAEWAGYPRSAEVKLYVALGAYRIGVGDGGANDQDEWFTGHNIADQIGYLRTVQGIDGYALFRYHHLTSADDPLYRQEAAAVAEVNAG